jgi:hypothetical protein
LIPGLSPVRTFLALRVIQPFGSSKEIPYFFTFTTWVLPCVVLGGDEGLGVADVLAAGVFGAVVAFSGVPPQDVSARPTTAATDPARRTAGTRDSALMAGV